MMIATRTRSASTAAWFCLLGLGLAACEMNLCADEYEVHRFQRHRLTGVYFSEGAHAGDLNGDQHTDIVYGPYWFEGPEFTTKHEIYEPVPQNIRGYAGHFFSWVYDFDGDGWQDVLVVGFPSKPAYVYQNPGPSGGGQHWKKHQVLDGVSNESPQFTDLVGDARPELVCTHDGFFGFATVDWNQPFASWQFHAISAQVAPPTFGHGLGVGDVNGDGRADLIHAGGWYEQPLSQPESHRWGAHAAKLSAGYGGAEMHAYDVDGDGDQDIITSDAAHDFGLSWYEQRLDEGEVQFHRHVIMGAHPAENKYGVLFSEPHSVALADLDGDGLKDIVTGKTYYSHHEKSPLWDAGAVVYWFRLVRTADGVDWVPYQIDDESGIGRQISLVDVDADGWLDVVVGGMKGAHLLRHQKLPVSAAEWQAAQPQPYEGPPVPAVDHAQALRGPKAAFGEGAAALPQAIEAESLVAQVTAGSASPQEMAPFKSDTWSGNAQLWWRGARPGDSLVLALPEFTGTVDLQLVLTCARDYGIVQILLDDQPLGVPVDLYEPHVVTTGLLTFPGVAVEGNQHRLTVRMAGANVQAAPAFMAGIDCVRIKRADESYVAP